MVKLVLNPLVMGKKPAKKLKSKKMDPVVHFEFPANDRKRIARFYKDAFGWQTQMLGKEMGNYAITYTSEVDSKGWPKKVGRINGGFYEKEGRKDEHPSVVIAVEDITKAIKKIIKAGGKVLGEPVMIPGIGRYVSFLDTEGNRISVMQPEM